MDIKRHTNFIISIIVGQIISLICLVNSVIVLNEKTQAMISEAKWGNTIYPRSVANSCLCLYREQNLLVVYIVFLFCLFALRFGNMFSNNLSIEKHTKHQTKREFIHIIHI